MGLGYMWEQAKQGNFSNALSGIFISDVDVQRGREVDQQLAQLNADNYAKGIITEEAYQTTAQRLDEWSTDAMLTREDTSPGGGFKEGVRQGAAGMQSLISDTLNTVGGGVLKTIPWQLWLLLAVAVAIYLWPSMLTLWRRR